MARKKTRFKWLTPAEFKRIKSVFDANVPAAKVKEIFGRSYTTLQYINESKTFKEYKERMALRQKKDGVTAEKRGLSQDDGVVKLIERQNMILRNASRILISIDSTLKLARKDGKLKLN